MNEQVSRRPVLLKYYHLYLRDEDSASLIKAVSQRYTIGSLERLARARDRNARRAALLALGFLASYDSNATFGNALHDEDRGVRLLAEKGIRQVWTRAGSDEQRQRLLIMMRLNDGGQFAKVVHMATSLINQAPWLAEAWNQRAVAFYYAARYEDSANDCHQTLELNPYHFGAAVGMGYCYMELNDPVSALESFQRALKLNPDLEGVRAEARRLEKLLRRKS